LQVPESPAHSRLHLLLAQGEFVPIVLPELCETLNMLPKINEARASASAVDATAPVSNDWSKPITAVNCTVTAPLVPVIENGM